MNSFINIENIDKNKLNAYVEDEYMGAQRWIIPYNNYKLSIVEPGFIDNNFYVDILSNNSTLSNNTSTVISSFVQSNCNLQDVFTWIKKELDSIEEMEEIDIDR